MKLLEYQGKELFVKYGIDVPDSVLVDRDATAVSFTPPFVLKAQVPVGDRKEERGILFCETGEEFQEKRNQLLQTRISGFSPDKILAEEKVDYVKELYLSFSYDTDAQAPVLAISDKGGTGIEEANIFPVDLLFGVTDFFLRNAYS